MLELCWISFERKIQMELLFCLRFFNANLLLFISLLQTDRNVTVIFLSEIVWEKFRPNTGCFEPFVLYFPDYSIGKFENIVLIFSKIVFVVWKIKLTCSNGNTLTFWSIMVCCQSQIKCYLYFCTYRGCSCITTNVFRKSSSHIFVNKGVFSHFFSTIRCIYKWDYYIHTSEMFRLAKHIKIVLKSLYTMYLS